MAVPTKVGIAIFASGPRAQRPVTLRRDSVLLDQWRVEAAWSEEAIFELPPAIAWTVFFIICTTSQH
jgi:hypothetical protein